MTNPSIFVAGIGNAGSLYRQTRHSAAFTLLEALASHLQYPAFVRSRFYAKGLVSAGSEAVFWQSPSLMNISGVGMTSAWRAFQQELRSDANSKLIVVHDELGSPHGTIKMRFGGSARGHNGIKSCFKAMGGSEFWKMSVGIGRPKARDPEVVSAYVLQQMSLGEMQEIHNQAPRAWSLLQKVIEDDKERKNEPIG